MSDLEPDAEVVYHGVDDKGRPYRLIGHLPMIDVNKLVSDHDQYTAWTEQIAAHREMVEDRLTTLIENPVDESRPGMVPFGFYWRQVTDDGWTDWVYVASRDEIPEDRSGIQVQTLWSETSG